MKTSLLMVLQVAAWTFAAGQSEFTVNTRQDSTQRDPHIARDTLGTTIVVWTSTDQAGPGSGRDILMQRLDASDLPLGGESLVNTTTTGDQEKPAIAINERGDAVIVWASFTDRDSMYDIKGRIIRNGVPEGSEFLVNTFRPFTQTNPSVAMDNDGAFVVAWDSWYQDGSDRGVVAQRFDAEGNKSGPEFQVNATTAFSQARPSVRTFPDGRFVIVWESWKQDAPGTGGYGMMGRVWNADGSPAGNEFPLNTTVTDYQWMGDAVVLPDTTLLAVWCSWGQDGSGGGIVQRRFSSAGLPLDAETIVNVTTLNYQWLPRVRSMRGGGWVVVWSSWKEDGDREGVYLQLYDSTGHKASFETRVNAITAGFQWEPDCVPTEAGEILAVWASWEDTVKNYDVVARRIAPRRPEAYVDPGTYQHAGRSTTRIVAHVVDSLALTGGTYDVVFDSLGNKKALATVRRGGTTDTLVNRFPVDKGENVFYLTPEFEGIALQILPEFDFALDVSASFFANHSGTNLRFVPALPATGSPVLAPIDIALIWGNTDTLANGTYVSPLDTALDTSLKPVAVPFRAWNMTDSMRVEMLVVEAVKNQRWDPGERVIFRTPLQYRKSTYDTHAELGTVLPGGQLVRPAAGDTNYLFTTRPLRQSERYSFAAARSMMLGAGSTVKQEQGFALLPNYPNPFNPSTTIRYTVPGAGHVRVRVFNVLGQLVSTLVDEVQTAGSRRVTFDGRGLASGVYFASVEWGSRRLTHCMMLFMGPSRSKSIGHSVSESARSTSCSNDSW